jgi:hypothetical protein
MENKNGEWRTAINKKKDKERMSAKEPEKIVTPLVDDATADKSALNLNNSFSSLVEKESDDKKNAKTTNVVTPTTPYKSNTFIKEWGYIQDPEIRDVMNAVNNNLEKCENFEQRMKFLQDSMASIADLAAVQIREQRHDVDNDKTTDRETVRGLHNLAQFGTSFSVAMSANLIVINNAIESIEKKKLEILDGWNKFVQDLNEKETVSDPNESTIQTKSSSFIGALEGGRHITTRNSTNLITASIGLIDIKCPVSNNPKDVPLMGIQYNPKLSCFVINLDGDLYSFGTGQFTYRKGKCVNGESTLYGKRCNPREMTCNGASCTYYHDPLKFSTHAHSTRNMAIPYIAEDLIKGIASDQEIVSNTSYEKNPFIVEDIVQLAGMLLLKAMSVKSIVKSNSTRSRPRRQPHPQRRNEKR